MSIKELICGLLYDYFLVFTKMCDEVDYEYGQLEKRTRLNKR